jgi:hypothetical protein
MTADGLNDLVLFLAMAILALDRGPLLLPLRRQSSHRLESLRIGVVVEDNSIPRWQKEFIEWLAAIEGFQVAAICLTGHDPEPLKPSRLFDAIRGQSSRKYDPFAEVPLGEGAGLNGASGFGIADHGNPIQVGDLKQARLDVVIWISSQRALQKAYTSFAKFGVISFQLGRSRRFPPYFDEVAGGDLLSQAIVWWHADRLDRARQLRTAQLVTDQAVRFTKNAAQPLVAVAQMAATICLEIMEQGDDWAGRAKQIPEQGLAAVASRSPTGLESASFVLRKLVRSLSGRLRHRGRRVGWFSALRRSDLRSYVQSGRFSAEALREIPLVAGSQMADPFLLDYEGMTFLYFEEVPQGRSLGRIKCAEVHDDGGISNPTLVLEDERNLSYPCVFLHEGECFMIPESGERRTVNLYRSTRMPHEFTLETTYLDDTALSDTTPVLIDGTWYFFTTTYEPFMQSLLFWSDRLDGRWHLHPKSPVSSSAQNSRGAGAIKLARGRMLRPTQDCSVRYGYAILINEIVRLTRTEFEERPVDRLLPTWQGGLLGTHTWNTSSKFEVFDGLRHLA